MKIVCVAGGSYKSFYLNHYLKLKSCDLLIFNYGIIYDYDAKEEILGNAIISKELQHISKTLNCTVVAGVFLIRNNEKQKSILVCDKDKLYLNSVEHGAKINIKNISFMVGDRYTNFFHFNKIILTNKRIYPNINNCSSKKIYIFCDGFGVDFIQNKKLVRNFNKYSKFVLK